MNMGWRPLRAMILKPFVQKRSHVFGASFGKCGVGIFYEVKLDRSCVPHATLLELDQEIGPNAYIYPGDFKLWRLWVATGIRLVKAAGKAVSDFRKTLQGVSGIPAVIKNPISSNAVVA